MQNSQLLVRWIPFIFVVLWATGFIGAKYGLRYAEPFTLLLVRMLLNVAVFVVLAFAMRARRPNGREMGHAIAVGILVHGLYLGGIFAAIAGGMPAAISSLLVGLQPILVAYLAWLWMGDPVRPRQTTGLMLGLVGVFAVVYLGGREIGSMDFGWWPLIYSVVSLLAISVGTLYQKRYCGNVDLISGTLFQYIGASLFLLLPAFLLESGEISWTLELVLVLTWMITALSTVAVLLLMYMIREGQASKVASYFYLVPGVTAIMAWIAFGETLSMLGLLGLLTSALGVYLVVRS